MPSLPDMNATNVVELARAAAAGQRHDHAIADVAPKPALFEWLCRMGDTTLILGHRLSEWCGHGPALEEDIALANTALDLIGQTELWLSLAAEVEDAGRTADDLAFLRDSLQFRNILLVERPNGDIGHTLIRQFLFDAWHAPMLTRLAGSTSARVADIAAKAVKEATYHLERSSDLVIRLGDGTAESHARMQRALYRLWPYAGEMFAGDGVDAALAEAGIAPAPETLRPAWDGLVRDVLAEATLNRPEGTFAHKGGKTGRHSEHLGHLLAPMQFLQRAYPGAVW